MQNRRLRIAVLMAVLALVLVACGGDDDDSSNDAPVNDSDTTSQSSEDDAANDGNLTGTISGAVEKDFAFNARFSCQDSGIDSIPDIFEMVATPGTEQLYVSLPFDTAEGTFSLVGSDTSATGDYDIRYRSADQVTYDIGDGEIIIASVPIEPGQFFSGSLSADLADADGNAITITAEFAVSAASFAFDGCE